MMFQSHIYYYTYNKYYIKKYHPDNIFYLIHLKYFLKRLNLIYFEKLSLNYDSI